MGLWALVAFCLLSLILVGSAEQCGGQAGGRVCPGGACCSKFGWCGNTADYCGSGCQSQCSSTGDIGQLITRSMFNDMLKHRNEGSCPGKGFYTYDAFIAAAKAFPGFGTTGDTTTRKREIAAFLAQTSHETTGGWASAPDGPYAWGYCYLREQGSPGAYCVPSAQWPCAAGRKYYGRGPIQISYNYNYGQAGKAIGVDLVNNPDLVATDAVISFKTAFWFWMTPQSPKPSCHNVITGGWTPSGADRSAGRLPGFGVITNIINGGVECGKGVVPQVQDRIGFYKRYCDILRVSYGNNLDCNNQRPFGSGLLLDTI
ncbi:hypothetical protein VitviT2T_003208 [Vitis vinifera]|uniref:Basic endochitinase n=3 Tax=Vitis vinifera TaxID=29760 RepID=CHIB_VITVI|nr:RecName: Full=Basic endochitinase; Flags: Precursor [Vitis vinifera]ABB53242.1 chitinase class I [Vitis vinifera]RVW48420.1 Basic endochitinase [Vitis vinifera]RVX12115.1 Basic endochitinase [Vitis vinifera]WJZ83537.1 hypothetical protein VitviT2T_003208 [Vitis vinifera]CAA90970.1 chitinase [Vitis vinifera]